MKKDDNKTFGIDACVAACHTPGRRRTRGCLFGGARLGHQAPAGHEASVDKRKHRWCTGKGGENKKLKRNRTSTNDKSEDKVGKFDATSLFLELTLLFLGGDLKKCT